MAEEPDSLRELTSLLDPGIRMTTGSEPPPDPRYRILVAGVPDRRLVEASPELAELVIPWSGVPQRTRELMSEFPGVSVHNLHHNAQQVAEMAVALLLAAAKCLVPMDRNLRSGDWSGRYESSDVVLLDGRTAVVLGYGAIGRRVAHLCRGLGLTVTGVRRGAVRVDEATGPDSVRAIDELDELLPDADVLLVCLPLTRETEGLIGARELALMPDRAILVNVGRGPVVDEAALFTALSEGTLHAAGIDVWYSYPTDEETRGATRPSAFPFETLDNVVMSPHMAGAPNTEETEASRVRTLAETLNAAARGEELPNRVDLEAGY
ncbi:MAG: hydroxyacid dehydrogenase [Candidatus Eisenbacteria bacterium]|nr:hydroxyacid dehydrogenase [Candidatus Eisenbacteria bacterium]